MARLALIIGLAASTLLPMSVACLAQTAPPATIDNNLKPKFIDQQPTDRLGSKLIGSDIVDKAKSKIGSLADIVFDEKNSVRSFIVSVGGILGIGSKYVAVDPSVLVITPTDGKFELMIDTDRDQLRAAPEYRYAADKK